MRSRSKNSIDWKTYLLKELKAARASCGFIGQIRERFGSVGIKFGDLITLEVGQNSKNKCEVTINWACIGQCDEATATKFADDMIDACTTARFINNTLNIWEKEYGKDLLGQNMP